TKDDNGDTVSTGSKCKIYTLPMKKDSSWEINLKSNDFDAFLRVEDSTGKELAFDDDSGGNLNAKLVFKAPKDDTYQIIATTYDANTTGKFTLTAESVKGKQPAPEEVSVLVPVSVPAQDKAQDKGKVYEKSLDEKAELTNDDPFDTQRKDKACRAKIYLFKMKADSVWEINMKTTD